MEKIKQILVDVEQTVVGTTIDVMYEVVSTLLGWKESNRPWLRAIGTVLSFIVIGFLILIGFIWIAIGDLIEKLRELRRSRGVPVLV